jgi:hypothetical protein
LTDIADVPCYFRPCCRAIAATDGTQDCKMLFARRPESFGNASQVKHRRFAPKVDHYGTKRLVAARPGNPLMYVVVKQMIRFSRHVFRGEEGFDPFYQAGSFFLSHMTGGKSYRLDLE